MYVNVYVFVCVRWNRNWAQEMCKCNLKYSLGRRAQALFLKKTADFEYVDFFDKRIFNIKMMMDWTLIWKCKAKFHKFPSFLFSCKSHKVALAAVKKTYACIPCTTCENWVRNCSHLSEMGGTTNTLHISTLSREDNNQQNYNLSSFKAYKM